MASSPSRLGGANDPPHRQAHLLLACVLLLLVAVFLARDPFHLSVLGSDPSFEAKAVPQPPASVLRSFARDERSRLKHARKWFVDGQQGPESLVVDPAGGGPYTGVADGRILKWDRGGGGDQGLWREFAYTSPNRSLCGPGKALPEREPVCGRPLGLRFDKKSGELLIADAYYGLMSVGPSGGLARSLAAHADGAPVRFANDLDVASDGSVYFTDSSSKYQRRNFFLLVLSGDDSGRVLKYDPRSNTTTVLLHGLQFPNGISLSEDEAFLVVAESVPGRLLKHWLKGEHVGSTEVLAILPGYPDNVRRNAKGDFWVAMHCKRNLPTKLSGQYPWLRRAFLQLPIPFKQVYRIFNGGAPHGIIAKYSSEGEMLEILEDVEGDVVKYTSQVDEQPNGVLWLGSVLLPYVAIYDPSSGSKGDNG